VEAVVAKDQYIYTGCVVCNEVIFVIEICCCAVMKYDLKNNRSFLRRSKVDNVHLCDLLLGSSVNILGRQLTLVDYANEFTCRRLGFKTEKCVTLCLICNEKYDTYL